jgi:hypothetical protein
MDSWSRTEGSRRSGATELLNSSDDDRNSPVMGGGSASNKALEEQLRGLNVVVGSQRMRISALESQVQESGGQEKEIQSLRSEVDLVFIEF